MSFNRNILGSITRKTVNTNININRNINTNNNIYKNKITRNEEFIPNQTTSSSYQQPIQEDYSSDFTKIYSINYNNYIGNKFTIPDDIGIVLNDFSINLIPKKTNSVFKLIITINYNCSSHFNSYINLELKYKKTNSGSFNNNDTNNDNTNNNNNDNNNNDNNDNNNDNNTNNLINQYDNNDISYNNNDISYNNYINDDGSYSLGSYYLGTGSTSFLYNVFNASTIIQIPSTNNTLINFFIVAKIYNTQDDMYYDMSITDEYKPVILFDVPGNTFLIEEINS
tara:strand:- start:5689 stop:6534 length:846 start_codon:yes stop_codon:yes gene_type:complete